MKSAWKRLASDEDQLKDVEEALKDGRRALEYLKKILEERIEASHARQRAHALYETDNWALKQADYIGCQRTYKEIIDLLN